MYREQRHKKAFRKTPHRGATGPPLGLPNQTGASVRFQPTSLSSALFPTSRRVIRRALSRGGTIYRARLSSVGAGCGLYLQPAEVKVRAVLAARS